MEQLKWPRFALKWYKSGAAGMVEICTGVVEVVGLDSLSKWRSWFGGTHEEMEK